MVYYTYLQILPNFCPQSCLVRSGSKQEKRKVIFLVKIKFIQDKQLYDQNREFYAKIVGFL